MTRGNLLAHLGPHTVDPRLVVRGHHVGLDRRATHRQLGQRRHLEVTEHRHGDGTGDRRRRHDQKVRGLRSLGSQGISLVHAETVLLVDHHESEVGELHSLLEQSMCADHDAGLPGRRLEERLTPRTGVLRAGQQGNPGCVFGAAEPSAVSQRAEHGGDRAVVLLREHLRRREQRGLATSVDDGEHRQQGHHGLAGTDLPLQQPMHRHGAGQVGPQLGVDHLLAGGQLERQPGPERIDQPSGTGNPRPGRVLLRLGPTLGQGDLQHHRLVPGQPVLCPLDVGVALRPVDLLDGLGPGQQLMSRAEVVRQGIFHVVRRVQHEGDGVRDVPGADVLGCGIDDKLETDEAASRPLGFVEVDVGEQLVLRVGQLTGLVEPRDGAGEQPGATWQQIAAEPAAFAEERDLELAMAVGHDQLGDRPLALLHRNLLRGDHLGNDRHVLADLEGVELGQLPPLVVAPRVVAQQVTDGVQAQVASGLAVLSPTALRRDCSRALTSGSPPQSPQSRPRWQGSLPYRRSS